MPRLLLLLALFLAKLISTGETATGIVNVLVLNQSLKLVFPPPSLCLHMTRDHGEALVVPFEGFLADGHTNPASRITKEVRNK